MQGLIIFNISVPTERVCWLECQNLTQHSPVAWWVLNRGANGVIVNLRFLWWCVCFFIKYQVKHGNTSKMVLLYLSSFTADVCDHAAKLGCFFHVYLVLLFKKTDVTNETADWQWWHSHLYENFKHSPDYWWVSDEILTPESPDSFSMGAYNENDKALHEKSLTTTD